MTSCKVFLTERTSDCECVTQLVASCDNISAHENFKVSFSIYIFSEFSLGEVAKARGAFLSELNSKRSLVSFHIRIEYSKAITANLSISIT